jgi:putative ABC transport system permease protein
MTPRKQKKNLPRLIKVLLWLFLSEPDYDQAAGDFEEFYKEQVKLDGKSKSHLRLWAMLSKSLPGFIWDSLYWRGMMIINYLKTAFRVIRKQKLFSALNIIGLAVSLTCILLILFHVKDELSYEKCFPKWDRIYRIQVNSQYGPTFRHWARSAPPLGPRLQDSFPEIEEAVRLRNLGQEILSYTPPEGSTKRFKEQRGFLADPAVVSVFDLEFIQGNPKTSLNDPYNIVLTEKLAQKYFGTTDPIGKTLVNENQNRPLQVTGVIQDFPRNTHLHIDYLVSMTTFAAYLGENKVILEIPTWKAVYTYVLLVSHQKTESFDTKSPPFMKSFLADRPGVEEQLKLQPISKIHLHSKLEGELSANSDITYVYVFSGAVILILLIAGVNYINLSTAQSFKRMKEIGVRKVIGAHKSQLIKQYLGESLVITFLSSLLTLILLGLSLPFYNQLTGKNLVFSDVMTTGNILFMLILIVVLSLLAGIYPAVFVSRFQAADIIKSTRSPLSSGVRLRKGLVIFQFVISIFMIFSTITMYRQLSFFHHKDLGFDKDRLIALPLYGDLRTKMIQNTDALKAEILRHSSISHASLVSSLPGISFSNERLTPSYIQDRNSLPMMRFLRVDEDFIETAGLELVKGRNFNKASDQGYAYIISETAQAALDLEQPLGVECRSDIHGGEAPIVGVIKDFHFASLHSPIEPLVLEYAPSWTGYILVKFQNGTSKQVLDFLRKTFKEIAPEYLFQYQFVDDVFDRNYENETRSFDLFRVFSIIALMVACLGLFGLSIYSAEVRTKEMGIRKVLGASVPNIAFLLTGDFIRSVFIANIVAWPLAYFAMNKWLESFSFRIHINIWTFVISASFALFFSVLTVSYQALKTASGNPVKSLRYE